MIRQLALILAALLSIAPASAQTSAPPADPADVRVTMLTEQGPVVIAVHSGKLKKGMYN